MTYQLVQHDQRLEGGWKNNSNSVCIVDVKQLKPKRKQTERGNRARYFRKHGQHVTDSNFDKFHQECFHLSPLSSLFSKKERKRGEEKSTPLLFMQLISIVKVGGSEDVRVMEYNFQQISGCQLTNQNSRKALTRSCCRNMRARVKFVKFCYWEFFLKDSYPMIFIAYLITYQLNCDISVIPIVSASTKYNVFKNQLSEFLAHQIKLLYSLIPETDTLSCQSNLLQ